MPIREHGNTGNANATQELEPKSAQVKFRCTEKQKFEIERNADKMGFKNVSEYALAMLL